MREPWNQNLHHNFKPLAGNEAFRRLPSHSSIFRSRTSFAILMCLGALFVSDSILSIFGNNSVVKGLQYSISAITSGVLLLIGLANFRNRNIPVIYRAVVSCFLLLTLTWFAIWFAGSHRDSLITIIINPSYSVLSWLSLTGVLVTAGRFTQFHLSVTGTKMTALITLILVLACVAFIKQVPCDPLPLCTALFYSVTMSAGSRRMKLIALGVAAIALILAGFRGYTLATLFLGSSLFLPMRIKSVLFLLIVLIILPYVYFVIIQYLAIHPALVHSSQATLTDTRTFLFKELMGDLSPTEFWLGRGIDGKYFSPFFYHTWGESAGRTGDFYYRSGVEVGWLNIILKFGIFGLIIFMAYSLYPVMLNAITGRTKDGSFSPGGLRFCLGMTAIFLSGLAHKADYSNAMWMLCIGLLIKPELSIAGGLQGMVITRGRPISAPPKILGVGLATFVGARNDYYLDAKD